MDYEKMYKAVLKTATQWIKDGCSDKEKICLESIFPELRESEDERIRKGMIEHFKAKTKETWCNMPVKDIIAYFEKQKERKPAECLKDTLIEWANFVLKCQEEELAKYDGPSYMKASTMGRIDAYKVLIAKLNSL